MEIRLILVRSTADGGKAGKNCISALTGQPHFHLLEDTGRGIGSVYRLGDGVAPIRNTAVAAGRAGVGFPYDYEFKDTSIYFRYDWARVPFAVQLGVEFR